MEPIEFWHWWVAAAVFGALEMLLPGAVFLWLAAAAGVVGLLLLALPWLAWQVQLLAFALFAMASVWASRRYLRRHPAPSDHPTLNRRGEQYVGRLVRLESPLTNGRGRAHVDDGLWTVAGDEDLPSGTTVRVVGVDGTMLRVTRDDAQTVKS